MLLSAADRTAVDRVCGSIDECVVLVVAGRPLILTDQLGEIDALVASWLPGSQGEGVADVLFGNRPFTGRLPQTWPRTLEQEPINVGTGTTTRSTPTAGACAPTRATSPGASRVARPTAGTVGR